MATQLLNADAALATIQDLLGHGQITTTQRYCRVANLKVQRDYYKAMEVVLQRTQAQIEDDDEGESIEFPLQTLNHLRTDRKAGNGGVIGGYPDMDKVEKINCKANE